MIIYATEVQTLNSFVRLESLKEVYGLIWIFVPIFSLILGIITGVLVIVWLEREISAGIQQRIGPEYAGPLGILQALADGTKLLFKEDLRRSRGNTTLFSIGPSIAVISILLSYSVIPSMIRLSTKLVCFANVLILSVKDVLKKASMYIYNLVVFPNKFF